MTRGTFIDAEGVPVYRGTYGDKPALHGRFAFVTEAETRERPSDLHAWINGAWTMSPRLEAAARRREVLRALAQADAALPRALEDVIAHLGAEAALPAAVQDRLAAKRALRETLT
jgi:hypothetical protein